jgi:hypothetical protein
MLRVQFTDTAARDAFASRFNLDSKVGENELDIGWHLLQFAKLDASALDYNVLALLQASEGSTPEKHEFIVKGDPATFGSHCTVKQDLGNNFYLVETEDGTILGDHVDSIEHNKFGMTFLAVGDFESVEETATALDPTTADGHWAKIRVSSRYRPLNSCFKLHDLNYKSKPELIVMDTGINFDHPEFDYPELEKEDFYALPVFNGNYRDDRKHGTAVASMAVGKNLGVASNCKLVNVKVGGADHNATLLEIGDAIDAVMGRVSSAPLVSRVVNISWGIARSSWLDAKIQSLLDAGVTVICAAGNDGISVEDISPAGLDNVVTVGSIDKYDIPSGFNNISPSDEGLTTGHGLSLDIFAPGEKVLAAISQNGNQTYGLISGTSFAAPIVSGIGITLAAMNEGFVPYSQLKSLILDTATKDALLFEDERFSENQNRLAYIIFADPLANYKETSMVSFLGIHSETSEPLIFDITSSINKDTFTPLFPNDTFTYSLEFIDPVIQAKYSEFVHIDPVTGLGTITKPTVVLPDETKLEMVEFKGVLTSSSMRIESNVLFFFNTNPLYKETRQSDITLALTNTNSISFYGAWSYAIK